jgi:nucleotide-binding universal stress UspA family protein
MILAAIDGSPAAEAAVEEAVKLAAAMNATVRFVHANSPVAEELFEADPETGPSRAQILARDEVLAHALERAHAQGVEAEVEVISSAHADTADLAASIAGIATGLEAAMIVVGSRGRGPIAGGLLGSVSHNLIRWATVPVLVVNAPDGEHAEH